MRISELEVRLATYGYVSRQEVIEELQQLANSMSTQKALAAKMGISEAYLCDILANRRAPGPKVLAFLKLEPVLVYKEVSNG